MREYAFPEVFKSILKEKNMAQIKFAWDNDINPKTVNYWCNNRRKPTLENVMYIAETFGLSTDYLIYGANPDSIKNEYVSLHTLTELVLCMMRTAQSEEQKEAFKAVIGLICDIPKMEGVQYYE